jgi:hypothetical protein
MKSNKSPMAIGVVEPEAALSVTDVAPGLRTTAALGVK